MEFDSLSNDTLDQEALLRRLFPNVVEFVDNRLKHYDGSHDVEHARRVFKNCSFLSSNTRGCELVFLASYAHDACDHKYGNVNDLQELLLCACLKDNMKYEDTMMVTSIVGNISYSNLRSRGVPNLSSNILTKWRIVSDADILEAMGITGIVRTIMYQAFKKKPLNETFTYIEGPLFECIQHLYHKKSRKEGHIRHDFMVSFMLEIRNHTSLYEQITRYIYDQGRHNASFTKTWNGLLEWSSGKCSWLHSQMIHESEFGN